MIVIEIFGRQGSKIIKRGSDETAVNFSQSERRKNAGCRLRGADKTSWHIKSFSQINVIDMMCYDKFRFILSKFSWNIPPSPVRHYTRFHQWPLSSAVLRESLPLLSGFFCASPL